MNSANKVGEIFQTAGAAFSKLGEMTMQLHQPNESGGTKWTDEEINMLHSCITKFGDDLNVISQRIMANYEGQIRTAIKKKAYEDAGVSPTSTNSNNVTPGPSTAFTDSTGKPLTGKALSRAQLVHQQQSTSFKQPKAKQIKLTTPIPQQSSSSSSSSQQQQQQEKPPEVKPDQQPLTGLKGQDVTLNMLNASDTDNNVLTNDM